MQELAVGHLDKRRMRVQRRLELETDGRRVDEEVRLRMGGNVCRDIRELIQDALGRGARGLTTTNRRRTKAEGTRYDLPCSINA